MNIIGFSIREVHGKKDDNFGGQISINNRVKINDIKEEEIKSIGKKALIVDFEYKTEYLRERKKVAEIKLVGNILLLDKNQSKIAKEWKKEKKIDEQVNLFLINSILQRSIYKAFEISDQLQILPPIPLPVAKGFEKSDEDTKYIG